MTKRYCVRDFHYGVIKYVTKINEPKDEIQDDSIAEENPNVSFKKIKTEPPKSSPALKYRVKQENDAKIKKEPSRPKSPSTSKDTVVIVIDDDEVPTPTNKKRSLSIKREKQTPQPCLPPVHVSTNSRKLKAASPRTLSKRIDASLR